MLKYKRVSLKLSGEAMGGGKTIDFAAVAAIAREIKTLVEAGVEVGVTIGAGNIWRGRSGGSMDRNRADQMGMLALYNLIGINQKEDQPMCIGTVKTMLDKAMERAQSGLFKRSKKRVDRDGYTVLFEKDFS